ncbi:MAG: leucine-rich repeat domain-containing protein [Clostridiales bacterium]|nr:leucine-rich repeat domain-containing protein [Clostridiales bacterium]
MTEETASEPEDPTDAEDTEEDEESDNSSFIKFNAKNGVLKISGVEDFTMPEDLDISSIKKIVMSKEVLSADLTGRGNTYDDLESVKCSDDCQVSIFKDDISGSPFYQNSKNWTRGVLYIGSTMVSIGKDAPKVCVLKSNLSLIESDATESLANTAPQIERFEIAESNKDFKTDALGILYSKDQTRIEMFPPASPVETFDLPDSVKSLQIPASKNLKVIRISARSSLEYVDHSDLNNAPITPLREYIVADGHPNFYSEDGVLFSKGRDGEQGETVLLDYPRGRTEKEYTIPDKTERVGYGAFQDSLYLEKVNIPASVSDLGDMDGFFSAFIGCKKLTRVNVDKGNDNYSSTADGLLISQDQRMVYLPGRTSKNFTVPSDIKGFEVYGNEYLETIELGKNVESFSADECPSLRSFSAENNKNGYYTNDGVLYRKMQDWEETKKENTWLVYYPVGRRDKEFTVPDGVTHLNGAGEWSSDSAFRNNPYIEEIALPDSVTFIGIGAFAGCTSLKKVNLPDKLKNLGNGAFHGCTSLKEITIPTSLEALGYYDGIDSYALFGSSITDIYYKGTKAQWDKLVKASDYPAILPGGVTVHCAK